MTENLIYPCEEVPVGCTDCFVKYCDRRKEPHYRCVNKNPDIEIYPCKKDSITCTDCRIDISNGILGPHDSAKPDVPCLEDITLSAVLRNKFSEE